MMMVVLLGVAAILVTLGSVVLLGDMEARPLAEVPTTRCADVEPGSRVRLRGRVWSETTVEAPLSHRPCVYYALDRIKNGPWSPVGSAAEPSPRRHAAPLWGVRDDSGFVAVDLRSTRPLGMLSSSDAAPEDARPPMHEFAVEPADDVPSLMEYRMEPGMKVDVYGWAHEVEGQLRLDDRKKLSVFIGGAEAHPDRVRKGNMLGFAIVVLGIVIGLLSVLFAT